MWQPDAWWTGVTMVGFVGYILSLVALVWRGFDRDGRIRRKTFAIWTVAAVIFLLMLLKGLASAAD